MLTGNFALLMCPAYQVGPIPISADARMKQTVKDGKVPFPEWPEADISELN